MAWARELAERTLAESDRSDPTLMPGSDKMVNMPEERPAIKLYGDDVALDFEQAPLVEVVHAIMGDILGLDYVIERTKVLMARAALNPAAE